MRPSFSPTTASARCRATISIIPSSPIAAAPNSPCDYEPAESTSGMFGGNSNWRGPVWFPVNYLIIESLQKFHHYYGDDFKIECPTGSGQCLTIDEVANELTRRLSRLFLRDATARARCSATTKSLQNRPPFPRLPAVPRIFPRRHRPRRRRLAPDRLDWPDRQALAAEAESAALGVFIIGRKAAATDTQTPRPRTIIERPFVIPFGSEPQGRRRASSFLSHSSLDIPRP